MVYDPRQDPKYANDKVFLALLKQESGFNPNAVSPTGARGYAQILQSTARDPGFGITPNIKAITDPESNVAFGHSYLEAMKKRYNGDTQAALVAYNGGPAAADRWVKSGKDDSVISKESSNYYKAILGTKSIPEAGASTKVARTKPIVEVDDEPTTKKVSRLPQEQSNALGSNVVSGSSDTVPSDDSSAGSSRVGRTSSSSSDSDTASKQAELDIDTDFGKVKRGLNLTAFAPSAMFRPPRITFGADADDPRLR